MINIFLKVKPWLLFVLTFALAFVCQQVMQSVISKYAENPEFIHQISEQIDNPSDTWGIMKFVFLSILDATLPFVILYLVVEILSALVYYGWVWAVSTGLNKKAQEYASINTRAFKFFFFYNLVYFPFLIGFGIYCFVNNWFHLAIIPFIVLSFLFAIFCSFYLYYFAAKTYKTIIYQREVKFSDFVGEFFCFWFHFVGVWVLQPKIIKIANGEDIGTLQATMKNNETLD